MVRKNALDKYGIISHNDKKGTGKTTILFHQKLGLEGGLLTERIIWKINPSNHYPLGIKYRLILVNPITAEVILLFDNHWPKGPHIHWPGGEMPYKFVSVHKLLKDFIRGSQREEKKYHENKKNNY